MRPADADEELLARLLAEEAQEAPRGRIPRRPAGADAPLSFGQRRLWFLQRLVPGSGAYNISAAFRLKGPLDPRLFGESLERVAARHEILRSVFPAGPDGEPFQRVLPAAASRVRFELSDLSAASDPAAEARRAAAEEAARPFDLEAEPPARVRLLRLGPQDHAVACTLHHIVSDGWSTGILIRELGAHYATLAGGREPRLPELPVQYGDYAAWQRSPEAAAAASASLAWWRKRLEGLPALELPADFPRASAPRLEGGRVPLDTGPAARTALAELARREGTTLFAAVLAACQAALAAWSGQRDFAVGAPVAGRTRREFEPLIGFFVNTLVFRADVRGDPTFAELVGRTRKAVQAALARQDAPFDRLVEELNPERLVSHTPLVQAVLAFEHAPDGGLALPGIALEPIEPETVPAKFDLTVGLADSPSGLRGSLDYRADLFAPETAAGFAGLLRRFLAAAAEPGRRLSEIAEPDPAGREALLRVGRGPDARADPALSVPAMVAERARRSPDSPAVREPSGGATYGALVSRARRLARALRARGAGPEKVVAVCLPRSADLAAAQLAVWFAGGAYLPLDPGQPAARLRAMAADAGACAVVAAGPAAATFGEDAAVVPPDAGREEDSPFPDPAPHPEELAYVVYTSGSTGRPKGVAVSHRALSNLVSWHRGAFALAERDTVTMVAGPAFDASVWEIWPALASGACVAVPPEEAALRPEALRDWIAAERATVSFVPTPVAELLLGLPWPGETALRWLLTGGDRLRSAPPAGLPFRVSNNYGPTEHAVVATSGPVEAGAAGRAPDIGRPIARTCVHLMGPELRPVPRGAVGEIVLSGPSLARGYLGRPDLTAEAFLPDPLSGEPGGRMYRTGDLARWRPDGTLEFRGRADRQVKIRGVRIELGEVEAALLALPGIRAAAADVRSEGGEAALVAWVVGEPGSEDGARSALRERLPSAMVPARWVWLEKLPLTPNGKVDRRALPAPQADAAAAEPPATPLEAAIERIWCEALGRERVGVERSFFDAGGHSLLLVHVQASLEARLGRPVPLLDLFAHPTVRALARHLGGGAEGGGADRALEEASRRGAAQRRARERRRDRGAGGTRP